MFTQGLTGRQAMHQGKQGLMGSSVQLAESARCRLSHWVSDPQVYFNGSLAVCGRMQCVETTRAESSLQLLFCTTIRAQMC